VKQLAIQTIIALVSVLISGVGTTVIGLALKATLGWRVSRDVESDGIDAAVHGETAYDISGVSGGRFGSGGAVPTTAPGAKTPEGATA
jgi:Amt family ammonium transporter